MDHEKAESELSTQLSRRGLKAEFELPEEPIDELDDEVDEDDDAEIRLLRDVVQGDLSHFPDVT